MSNKYMYFEILTILNTGEDLVQQLGGWTETK